MNLHEYQAKRLFHTYAIPVPQGFAVRSVEDVPTVCAKLGGSDWVIKAQVHAGGRGKAGGVVAVADVDQAEAAVGRLLGSSLVTPQSDARGLPVTAVLIEEPAAIARELYLGLLVNRERAQLEFIASTDGGMEIEAVAASAPERILRVCVHPASGLQEYQVRNLGRGLELDPPQVDMLRKVMEGLYQLFLETDATLVEINPLIVTQDGDLLALDAKVSLDDNALYRHSDLADWRDTTQEDSREAWAQRCKLNYIRLDGDIGCMVNGAGLAMATMDLVKLEGGAPANFLDVGGSATAERVAEAFKLILSDGQVNAILVNIFGGIVRCDLIARGIIQALQEVQVSVPVVVRLAGTNAAQGLELLAQSGLSLETADSLGDAAARVVSAARRHHSEKHQGEAQ